MVVVVVVMMTVTVVMVEVALKANDEEGRNKEPQQQRRSTQGNERVHGSQGTIRQDTLQQGGEGLKGRLGK
jgi:hypothetical protein